jgi:hypothetical protein
MILIRVALTCGAGDLRAGGRQSLPALPHTGHLAQETHRRLYDEVPKGYWSMIESGDAIS